MGARSKSGELVWFRVRKMTDDVWKKVCRLARKPDGTAFEECTKVVQDEFVNIRLAEELDDVRTDISTHNRRNQRAIEIMETMGEDWADVVEENVVQPMLKRSRHKVSGSPYFYPEDYHENGGSKKRKREVSAEFIEFVEVED